MRGDNCILVRSDSVMKVVMGPHVTISGKNRSRLTIISAFAKNYNVRVDFDLFFFPTERSPNTAHLPRSSGRKRVSTFYDRALSKQTTPT